MGMGYAFALVLVVLVLAPVLWFAGWALDYVTASARHPRRYAPAPVASPSRPAGSDGPRPVDRDLAAPAGAVGIYRLADFSAVGSCSGPDGRGACPRAHTSGAVPCAGCVLALPVPVHGSRAWHVPAGYRGCPLGSYEAYIPA